MNYHCIVIMATVQVRVSDEDKKAVEKILRSWGLDVTTAIRAFFKRIQVDGGMPFSLNSRVTVNGFTPEFEQEVLRSESEDDRIGPFDTAEEFIESLKTSDEDV